LVRDRTRIALFAMAHLSDDETAAKMGVPKLRCAPASPQPICRLKYS
jgi:hypothetical protein